MENLLIGVPIVVALLATGVVGAHSAIRRTLKAPRQVSRATPDQHGVVYYCVRVPTKNGKFLAGWLMPAPKSGDSARSPAIAILHGWGGNAGSMLPLALPLRASGQTVLLIEARCHGGSDGDSFASLPRFAEDLDSAIDWLRALPSVDPERISVLGHSVGAGAALLSASRRKDLRAVISVAAFAHPATAMRRFLAAKRVPHKPVGWYIQRYVQRVIGHRFDDIAPINTIAGVSCPVLLVHGERDDTVPVDEARAIHARRGDTEVQLLIVDGDHESFADLKKQIGKLVEFLAGDAPNAAPDTPFQSEDRAEKSEVG